MRFLCLCLALSAFACGPASNYDQTRSESTLDASSFEDVSSRFPTYRDISEDERPIGEEPVVDNEIEAQQRPSDYPLAPESDLTPGSRCSEPDEYRYSEKIPYCRRSVSKGKKDSVIRIYDEEYGYSIENMDRQDFKVDHYIPLCMGGSNSSNNLWPQHESTYRLTDPIEAKLCDLLASGEVKQAEAIEKITYIKHHTEEATALLNELTANGFKNLR